MYLKAEQRFKSADNDQERLDALQEMLRVIPRHKGTEHIQAELRKKLSKLKAAVEGGAKKSGSGRVDIFHIPKSGSGQVALIGTPNCGKSSLVGAMSKAKVNITDYPYGTDRPVPGMIMHEDVKIEMVDTPPVTAEHAAPGQVQTYRGCDLIGIVIDLSDDVLEQMEVCVNYLNSHRLLIDDSTGRTDETGNYLVRPTFVICTKSDLAEEGTVETLKELVEHDFEYIEVSIEQSQTLEYLSKRIFEMLGIVRVYAKKPGKPVDKSDPFTLPTGSTVIDLALLVHRELAEKLKTARSWDAPNVHDGQSVQRTHVLSDKEIIELHF